MPAVFSDLFVWYQIPILIVLVVTFILFSLSSKRKSIISTKPRSLIVFGKLVILFFLFGALILPSVNRARVLELCAVCKTRLKGLGTAIELYHQTNKAYPPSPKEMIKEGFASIKNFKCPLDTQDREISYFYLPPLETDDGETFVMCDYKDNHENKRFILAKAGHVVEYSEEEFQAELKKPHNTRFAEALKKEEGL
ncbi:MAG: hypothetical protein JXA11_11985 [Phycisphaerae bacterium]|nr:hypothetical protein [Phycisphaerae bacterium]